MREIKFRAWDKFNDFMWYQKDSAGLFLSNMEELEKGGNGIELMQFTGLRDKNGKDAWEGDIIYIKHGECVGHHQDGEEIWESIKGVISFEDSMFVFNGHSCGTLPLYAYKDSFEVIGNIYQNP